MPASSKKRSDYQAAYYRAHRKRILAASKLRRKADPDKARIAQKRDYASHKAAYIARATRWGKRNPEKKRLYREANSAKIVAKVAEWKRNNPDKVLASQRKQYAARHAEINASRAEWRKNNPDKVRAVSVKQKAVRKQAPGSFTAADIRAQRAKQNNRCAYCACDMGNKYTIDHVLAIKNGGTNDPSNIVLACLPCNLKKGTKSNFTPRG